MVLWLANVLAIHSVHSNNDFLSKCSREKCEDTLLVMFDVVNLYSNIPHTFGLEAGLLVWKRPIKFGNKEYVLECAKFILQNDNMKFNNEFYNQIKGAAMGTIFAPTYATLLMGYFEIKLYSVWTFNYGELLVEYIKENWNRFLDDCSTVLRSSQLVLKSYYSLITQLILQCSSLRNIVRTTFHF